MVNYKLPNYLGRTLYYYTMVISCQTSSSWFSHQLSSQSMSLSMTCSISLSRIFLTRQYLESDRVKNSWWSPNRIPRYIKGELLKEIGMRMQEPTKSIHRRMFSCRLDLTAAQLLPLEISDVVDDQLSVEWCPALLSV